MPVRLACVKHAASVHPEPGSNSPLYLLLPLQALAHGFDWLFPCHSSVVNVPQQTRTTCHNDRRRSTRCHPISGATRDECNTPALSRQIQGAPVFGTRSAFVYGLSSGGYLVQAAMRSHHLLSRSKLALFAFWCTRYWGCKVFARSGATRVEFTTPSSRCQIRTVSLFVRLKNPKGLRYRGPSFPAQRGATILRLPRDVKSSSLHYIERRPSRARDSVTSSVYSKSPPTGRPRASRVILTPLV